MKRISLIPFLMLYLLTSFSMSAKIHFCGGELEAFKVNTVEKNDCCCESDEEQSDCCTDKQITIHGVDLHQFVPPASLPDLAPSVHYAFSEHSIQDLFSLVHSENISSYSHAPPTLARNSPLYISYCSLLI
ncbi:MAG: hypothetical protein HYZ54_00605 [Ignavibacteriae bacterium]|nr:hypothetical protein [Ignavibacteriota bacterium]